MQASISKYNQEKREKKEAEAAIQSIFKSASVPLIKVSLEDKQSEQEA